MSSWRYFSSFNSFLYLVYFVWSESALVSDYIQSKLLQYFSSSALQGVFRTHLGSLYMLFELSCNSLCHESSRLATTILAPHCSDRAPEAFKRGWCRDVYSLVRRTGRVGNLCLLDFFISCYTSVSHFWTEMLRFVLWRKCFEVNDEAPTMHRRQTPLSTLAFTKNLAACTSLFND